jgi:hypothetical protein
VEGKAEGGEGGGVGEAHGPGKELAKESFIARKKRQAAIYLARAAQAKRALALAELL